MTTNALIAIDVEGWRAALPRLDWWSSPWSNIADLAILPNGTRLMDDVWIQPEGWSTGTQCLDFTTALPATWLRDQPRAEALIRRLKRLAAIDFTISVRGKSTRVRGPGKWITWVTRNRVLHVAAKAAAETLKGSAPTRCPDGEPLFATLSPAALESVLPNNPVRRSKLVPRLNALFVAGVFDDWPAADVSYKWFTRQPGDPNVTQPFSDHSFTILCRAAFAVTALQEDLLACHREIAAIDADERGRRHERFRDIHRKARLAAWKGARLSPCAPLGVTLGLIKRTGTHHRGDYRVSVEQFGAWPFQTLEQVRQALSLCQTANWITLAAATGARAGELDALTRDALIEFVPTRWGDEGNELALLTGKTFKEEVSGTKRQWPLPRKAVEAFERQRQLAEVLAPGKKTLWFSRYGRAFMHNRLSYFCEVVSLDGEHPIGSEIDGSVHAQRFRETLARLVGLCLDNGHHVLFDVLGHREMDTTLGYMTSEPDFAARARRVRLEAEAVRKRRIIGNADAMGGPAAKEIVKLRNTVAKQAFGECIHPDTPSSSEVATQIADFAGIMSDGEINTILPRATIVRPGIYCVADAAQPGLCSKSTVRDVSRCSPICHHRLEEAAANDDRRRAVRYILDKTEDRTITSLQRAFFQRQLLDQFIASPALANEFLDDPRLHTALVDIAPGRIAKLPDGPREKLAALQAKLP